MKPVKKARINQVWSSSRTGGENRERGGGRFAFQGKRGIEPSRGGVPGGPKGKGQQGGGGG